MSDIENKSTGIKVLEHVVIMKGSNEKANSENVCLELEDLKTSDESDPDNLDSSVEKEISEIVQHSDPISPATAIPTKDASPLSDDESAKVILNLEVSPISLNSGENLQSISGDISVSKVAMSQLDQLTQKRGKSKNTQKDPLSFSSIQVESAIAKTDQNGKPPMKLHNRILASSSGTKELERDLYGHVTIAVEKSKKTLNKFEPETSNDDLVAILEGHDMNDENDKEEHYEVVEIIPDGKAVGLSDSAVMTKEEVKKIALEQISNIPKIGRVKRRKNVPNEDSAVKTTAATELVSSLASEWSDSEKESELKVVEKQEKKIIHKKNIIEKKESEPKIEPFRRSRVIKKKIIWDPDAPETQFSYASLVQTSAKKQQQKKTRTTSTPIPKKIETSPAETASVVQKGKRRAETPTILNNKKKKTSEIDRLLRDEGAANMISSLENEKPEKEVRIKKDTASPTVEKQTKKEATPKKRVIKPKASATWDYVYNQQNVDSMIIRRRSNSSYSSTSPRRLSLDQTPTQSKKASPGIVKVSPVSPKLPSDIKMLAVCLPKTKTFEFAKPEAKKAKKDGDNEISPTTIATDIKRTESRASARSSNRTPINVESTEVQQPKTQADKDKASEVIVKKHGTIIELHLTPKPSKVKNTFTVQLINEVVKQLNMLKTDNSCKVVFMTSAGPHFCQGVDFLPLAVGTVEKRKSAALELAASVRNLLQALASFPKPILAGITGACSGLGVTMLPLFDVVISSDKSTFDTSYAKIGQIPEGHCILTLTNNVRHNFKTKLLWLCEKINSTEAALSGLVTKLTSPAKIQEDTLICAKKVASLSQQTFSTMKSLRQKSELSKLIMALAEEQKILAQQWISPECQENFKQFMQKNSW